MFNILTLNKISKNGLSNFDNSLFTCGDNFDAPDALLVRSADMHSMSIPKTVKCIGRAGAGVNNIPVDKCSEAGIVVFNTPGANANAVKELAVCALFLSSRKIADGIAWAKSLKGNGAEVPAMVEKGKGAFVGPEIEGKTLGVIGLGAIGANLANVATSLGMNVYGYDPYISVDTAWGLSRSIKKAAELKTIFENCDYISVHVPLTPETRGFINKDSIAQMKNGVRIINLSRGELINDTDIGEALESGKVAAYVTDFPNDTVLGFKNVTPIPHLGASTPESEENCAVMAVLEVSDFLLNGNIKNSVNFPNVEMAREGKARLCVIHKNVPNMVGSISSALAEAGVNIENMINKSKKDYAYTLIDTNSEITGDIIDQIKKNADIISIRVI